jgi:hypothetical protein
MNHIITFAHVVVIEYPDAIQLWSINVSDVEYNRYISHLFYGYIEFMSTHSYACTYKSYTVYIYK